MPTIAPEQPAIAAPPRITANRKLLTKRAASIVFTISSGGLSFWEVLLFTDRALIDPRNAARRTPADFYSSRQDGGLRRASPAGDDVFLVPSAVLRGFMAAIPRPAAIYYAVAGYADAGATSPMFSEPPELLALDAPSVQLSPDFTPDAVDSVLGIRANRLTVVAQALDAPIAAAPAPPPAAPEPSPPPLDAATDAAAGEDGYSYYAAHPELIADTPPPPTPAPAPASPPLVAVAEPAHAQPYDDGYGEYDDGWGHEEGWAGAQGASFPAGFDEPAPLIAAEAELDGVERLPYADLDEPDGQAAPSPPAPAPTIPSSLALTIDDKRSLLEHIAGGTILDRYGAINADGEFRGRFGPDHPAYHHHHLGLSFGVVQFKQESGDLGRLLTMTKQRDEAAFARAFPDHADELLATMNAVGPPSSQAPDGRSVRTQPVGGADLWDEPWLSRFRAAGAEPACQAAQNELAAALFIDPMLRFAADAGLDTDRALAIVVDRAAQLGCPAAKQWIMAATGPIQTTAIRQQALAALGFADLAAFQSANGLAPDTYFGPDSHAALSHALRALGANAPVQIPALDQMLDALVRRADADGNYWAASVRRLRTEPGFTDKPYPRA